MCVCVCVGWVGGGVIAGLTIKTYFQTGDVQMQGKRDERYVRGEKGV